MNQPIIRYDTVRNQVYNCIRQNIAVGYYKPGDRLNEQQIADELQVSRSPVREAIKQLTGDGFVVYIPNKGSFVKQLTIKELNDMYDMRVMIESYAIEKACENLSDELRKKLEDFRDKFPVYSEDSDRKRYIELDKEFHSAIVENTGNQYAIEVFNTLYIQISMFRTISLSDTERFRLSLQDHMKMIGYILDGSVKKAVRRLRIHLLYGKESVDTNLRLEQPPGR